jgi:hypothetical protein
MARPCALSGWSPTLSSCWFDYPPTPWLLQTLLAVKCSPSTTCSINLYITWVLRLIICWVAETLISSLDLLVLLLAILPFEASFPQMALVGVAWSPDALLGDATHGSCLLVPTQCLTASWLSSVGPNSIPYSCICGLDFFRMCLWRWHRLGSSARTRFDQ